MAGKIPTTNINDFLPEDTRSGRAFTARDVLTYLYAESKEWTEDVDGDCEDGAERVWVHHYIRITDGLLDELLDMAGINKARYDETPLERLKRANEEDANEEDMAGIKTTEGT